MKTLWVSGVNNLGTQGRWAFVEFTDPLDIQAAFDKLVDEARAANPVKENA
jgi:type III restriction enzyme